VAHVAHEDQVLAFLTGEMPLHAGQRLFGGVERQRCMPGNKHGKLIDASLQRRNILDNLIEQTDAGGFLGADESSSENKILHARRSNQSGEPADIRHREAIAERARDRKSDFRGLRPDAQIAARRYAGATADTNAGDRGDRGHAALLEFGEHPVQAGFILDSLSGVVKARN